MLFAIRVTRGKGQIVLLFECFLSRGQSSVLTSPLHTRLTIVAGVANQLEASTTERMDDSFYAVGSVMANEVVSLIDRLRFLEEAGMDREGVRLFMAGLALGLLAHLVRDGVFDDYPDYKELATWIFHRGAEAHIACGGNDITKFL